MIFGSTTASRRIALAGRMSDMVVLEPAPDPFPPRTAGAEDLQLFVHRRSKPSNQVRGVVTAGVTALLSPWPISPRPPPSDTSSMCSM
jgi:hypothetical protein